MRGQQAEWVGGLVKGDEEVSECVSGDTVTDQAGE